MLVPLTDNPNAPNKCGVTPSHWAAINVNIEIFKIFAPVTDNPNQTFANKSQAYCNKYAMQ